MSVECRFCGKRTADNCEVAADLKYCADAPAPTVIADDAGLPAGFHWERMNGEDGIGSSPGLCYPSTLYRRAVGPWEVERQGGRPPNTDSSSRVSGRDE